MSNRECPMTKERETDELIAILLTSIETARKGKGR